MKDIKTLEAVAELIKAQGGEEFCRGFITATQGDLYEKPNLMDYPDYLRGYLSAANREQLETIAGAAIPLADFTHCRDETVKREILKLVD